MEVDSFDVLEGLDMIPPKLGQVIGYLHTSATCTLESQQ